MSPAESVTKEFRFKYVLKRRTGGKSIGSFWNGRACKAVRRVARMVGGRGDSVFRVSMMTPYFVCGVDLLPQSIAMEMAVLLATWAFLVSEDILGQIGEVWQRVALYPEKVYWIRFTSSMSMARIVDNFSLRSS